MDDISRKEPEKQEKIRAQIAYAAYQKEAENIYLTAQRRWKTQLLLCILTILVFFAFFVYLFYTLDVFMHFFYIFVCGIIIFFASIAAVQAFQKLREERHHYQYRLRSALERLELSGYYFFEIPEEDLHKFDHWWN